MSKSTRNFISYDYLHQRTLQNGMETLSSSKDRCLCVYIHTHTYSHACAYIYVHSKCKWNINDKNDRFFFFFKVMNLCPGRDLKSHSPVVPSHRCSI